MNTLSSIELSISSSSSSIYAALKSSSVGVSPGHALNIWAQNMRFNLGSPLVINYGLINLGTPSFSEF